MPGTGETTIFVYDAAGKQIAEYSTVVASLQHAKVAYLTNDHLGSPRINTDRDGNVTSRHDYHPFGEEIITPERSNHPDYTPDDIRQQLTGYERDGETGLDFAQARMYARPLGRFSSCDPVQISNAHRPNPQRWNAYIYVLNNPMTTVDPDGRDPVKKVIDVFVSGVGNKSYRQWKSIKRDAGKKGVQMNLFTGKNATAENIRKSIETEGRTTVFVGHSFIDPETAKKVMNGGSMRGGGQGIEFEGGGAIQGTGPVGTTIGESVTRASMVAVFSCDFTSLRNAWVSEDGTQLLYVDPGADGVTMADSGVGAAQAVVKTLVNGGDLYEALQAAQEVYNNYQEAICSGGEKCNEGDTVVLTPLDPEQ